MLAPLRPCAAPPLLDGPPLPSQADLADGDVINTKVDLSINLKVIERRRYLPPDAAAGWQRIGEPSTHGGTADANRALGDAHSTTGVGNGEGAWEDGAEVFFKARAPPRPPACSQCRRPSLPLLPRRHLPLRRLHRLFGPSRCPRLARQCKKTTPLSKLMRAFCERQGKAEDEVRFVFDGERLRSDQTPAEVRRPALGLFPPAALDHTR